MWTLNSRFRTGFDHLDQTFFAQWMKALSDEKSLTFFDRVHTGDTIEWIGVGIERFVGLDAQLLKKCIRRSHWIVVDDEKFFETSTKDFLEDISRSVVQPKMISSSIRIEDIRLIRGRSEGILLTTDQLSIEDFLEKRLVDDVCQLAHLTAFLLVRSIALKAYFPISNCRNSIRHRRN